MTFAARRLRNTAILLGAVFLAYTFFSIVEFSLNIQQFYSGWLMFAVFAGLMLFKAKKRLSVLPIGSNAAWAQWHYYLGLFLSAIFLLHVEFGLPQGALELTLLSMFLIVTLSGVGGLIINRVFAQRLSILKEEVIYERIPQLREEIESRANATVLKVVEQSGSSTLSEFYLSNLAVFFAGPRNLVAHIVGSDFPYLRIQNALEQQMRYLNAEEAEGALDLQELVLQKNLLDRHRALQGVLKYWGMLHFPMGMILLLLVLLHIVLVYAFRGAA